MSSWDSDAIGANVAPEACRYCGRLGGCDCLRRPMEIEFPCDWCGHKDVFEHLHPITDGVVVCGVCSEKARGDIDHAAVERSYDE